MAKDAQIRSRLCLVTPPRHDAGELAPRLGDALGGGDVAALIVTGEAADPGALQRSAEVLTPIAQRRGVAAIVLNDTRVVGRTGADGVHVDSGIDDVAAAIAAFRGTRMVGAGGLASRHEAMLAGEAGPDYLFFGRLDGDSGDAIFAKAFDLAAWWSSVAVIPAVVMGARTLESVEAAAAADIAFVALSRAVWEDARGPAAAVAEACARMAAIREPVA
jgi:thiamine-phosphate pyrophosphorylase